jgi:hypothetical protein
MYSRHNEVPELDAHPGKIDAHYYNHVQLALKRMGNEIRLEIPVLKHLDLILQKDAWIIIDTALNDYPIATWSEFKTEHRDNLHQAIACTLRSYHFAATMVLKRTLAAMELQLIAELTRLVPAEDAHILPFKREPD